VNGACLGTSWAAGALALAGKPAPRSFKQTWACVQVRQDAAWCPWFPLGRRGAAVALGCCRDRGDSAGWATPCKPRVSFPRESSASVPEVAGRGSAPFPLSSPGVEGVPPSLCRRGRGRRGSRLTRKARGAELRLCKQLSCGSLDAG